MRRDTPPDPHFSSRKLGDAFAALSCDIPIAMLVRIRHDEREQLRARLLDLIERNEQVRRNGRRWFA